MTTKKTNYVSDSELPTLKNGKKKPKNNQNNSKKNNNPDSSVRKKAAAKMNGTGKKKSKNKTENTLKNAVTEQANNTEKKISNKTKNNKSKSKASGLSRYGKLSASSLSADLPLRIAFLGGINEIGKNLTLFEYNNEMIIVDCGMSFPDTDMPGVDYVLPDFSYVVRNADKIKGIFVTHGHEDHIGGIPYILKQIKAPVYATKLTIGLIEGKLREQRMLSKAQLNVINPGDFINVGEFSIEAVHVNHSIPDALAFAIKCGAGVVIHTGDFKIDNTPIDGSVIDLCKLAELGNEGVLALLQDSTNAERVGYTPSEKVVGQTLENLFIKASGKRIIVASFASNIHRIQQIVDASYKMGRKIFLSGRSLENVVTISRNLGYINIPDDLLVDINKLKNYRDEDVVIITTGSQGEPMSALSRMSSGQHKKVKIGPNDFIIISATPIPGNEKSVANTINELMKMGADVFYDKNLGLHVSGHAAQEELKLILNLVKPQYFIPVHGEQKHLRRHAQLAEDIGIPSQNIHIPELGSLFELTKNSFRNGGLVPAGRVYVDISGVGDIGNSVLTDRKKLSTDGVIIVTAVVDAYSGILMHPLDVKSKGFVFSDNLGELAGNISDATERIFDDFAGSVYMDTDALKSRVKDTVNKVVFDKTGRNPVVVVTVVNV